MNDEASTRQERERAHFDRLAEETGTVWWGSRTRAGQERQRMRAEMLLRRVARLAKPKCLEIGCGTGAFTRYALEQSPDLDWCGLDVSPKCIEIAERDFGHYANASFKVTDGGALPFEDGSVDVICGVAILHHLDVEQLARESLRVLKRGGLFWFAEPNMLNPHVALENNVRAVGKFFESSEDETAFVRWPLARLLRREGFTRIEVRPFDWLYPATPEPLIGLGKFACRVLERVPVVKEFSGSIEVVAYKR